MSQEIERYLQAGTRASTRRSYQQALEHFEVTWGGFLPATSDAIVRYLVDHAAMLSSNALKLRLAALAQWHVGQGFPDPTKTHWFARSSRESVLCTRARRSRPSRCNCANSNSACCGWNRPRESTSGGRLAASCCAVAATVR
ncbi:hypothetical protein P4131_31130 [Pseudomonas aeruginosa]|nr:hypothetical protein [Pseudomonas aeruginosa]